MGLRCVFTSKFRCYFLRWIHIHLGSGLHLELIHSGLSLGDIQLIAVLSRHRCVLLSCCRALPLLGIATVAFPVTAAIYARLGGNDWKSWKKAGLFRHLCYNVRAESGDSSGVTVGRKGKARHEPRFSSMPYACKKRPPRRSFFIFMPGSPSGSFPPPPPASVPAFPASEAGRRRSCRWRPHGSAARRDSWR